MQWPNTMKVCFDLLKYPGGRYVLVNTGLIKFPIGVWDSSKSPNHDIASVKFDIYKMLLLFSSPLCLSSSSV